MRFSSFIKRENGLQQLTYLQPVNIISYCFHNERNASLVSNSIDTHPEWR